MTDLKVGDKVRVSDPAFIWADGRGGVETRFYGVDGAISGTGDHSGEWIVAHPDGGTNYIHENYLTLIPQFKDGDRVRVSDPAYTRPDDSGYVSPTFFGKEVTVVRRSEFSGLPGCWSVEQYAGPRNDIHEKYLTPIPAEPEAPKVDLGSFEPTEAQKGEIKVAVDEALAEFKKEAARIAMDRARYNGSEYVTGAKAALLEMGMLPEDEKLVSRRFTGQLTITVPFDVEINDTDWDDDDDHAEDYIRNSVNSSLDGTLFDSDITEHSIGYAESIEVTNLERQEVEA